MVLLCGEPVLEMGLDGKSRLVAQAITSPGVYGYGEPSRAPKEREAIVERFDLGETSVVHQKGRIAVDIDLSSLALPPLSQIRYFRTASANELDYESFAITSPQKVHVSGRLGVRLYQIESAGAGES
jgi:hypothetical protein